METKFEEMRKRMLSVIMFVGCFVHMAFSSESDTAKVTPDGFVVKKIWDSAQHSAFTDLIRYKDYFYCSFREGSDHAGGEDGKVRIIKSKDGDNWQHVALIEVSGLDLRDPKLSVTPTGKLMVIMGGSVYENRKMLERIPQVSFSEDGAEFSKPEPINVDPEVKNSWDWVWRVTWHKGVGYAINWKYEHNGGVSPTGQIYLMKTMDGINYEKMYYFDVDGYPNESTIRFDKDDKMHVLIRRERGVGLIAVSAAPDYNDFKFQELTFRLGGPNFLHLDDNSLVLGSRYHSIHSGPKTVIHTIDRFGNVNKSFILPSGGDTSYPGMVIFDDQLWVSYYSSHEGKSSIYLAKLSVGNLR